jgi:hypothetical protein
MARARSGRITAYSSLTILGADGCWTRRGRTGVKGPSGRQLGNEHGYTSLTPVNTMKMRATERTLILIAIAMIAFAQSGNAQNEKGWQFPEALRPELDARLQTFVDAQVNGEWDRVATLLGKYRRGGNYLLYTPAHRACFVNEMKQFPMIRFNYKVWDKSFSSEILSTPPERRWWTLIGEAIFRKGANEFKKQIQLVAYRDKGDWYFTPPPFDNANAASHFTPEQLARDLQDKVVARVHPDSPLRFVDVHLFTDKDNVLSRKLQFRLRNTTGKRVTGYSYRISDSLNDGDISSGTGSEKDWIEPWAESHQFSEDDVTEYYWCEGQGEVQTIMEIQNVQFEDGSEWTAPEAPDSGHHE